MAIDRILLPVDFSELSIHAAEMACSMAQANDATVHVLHVLQPVEIAIPTPEVGFLVRKVAPDEPAIARRLDAFARDYLIDHGVRVVTVLARGKPAREIARYAQEADIDEIVIGTHARGIARRLVHGSVSKSVLEHASCAVTMVPPRTVTVSGETVPELQPVGHVEEAPSWRDF